MKGDSSQGQSQDYKTSAGGCRLTKETWERGHCSVCVFCVGSTTWGWDPQNSLHTCLCLSAQMGPHSVGSEGLDPKTHIQSSGTGWLYYLTLITHRTLQIHERYLKVWVLDSPQLPVPLQGGSHTLSISGILEPFWRPRGI